MNKAAGSSAKMRIKYKFISFNNFIQWQNYSVKKDEGTFPKRVGFRVDQKKDFLNV